MMLVMEGRRYTVVTWNIGSVSGKGEVCEELSKRMIDMCYL